MSNFLSGLAASDIVALFWFLMCWGGYNWYASSGARARLSLVGASHTYRLNWAKQLLRRENRVADSSLVGNLMGSVSFYANTTIYVIAGLMAQPVCEVCPPEFISLTEKSQQLELLFLGQPIDRELVGVPMLQEVPPVLLLAKMAEWQADL